MRGRRGRHHALAKYGVAAGYGLVVSVFTTYALDGLLGLESAGRGACILVTVALVVAAVAVIPLCRRAGAGTTASGAADDRERGRAS